ncbi:uncharacterized protein [Panulirus ornatus]|uniref:uncharacterized protein n=1 Tax=Panulirus ornatus TaxID=150431 RepID=UPI003A8B5B99
MWRYIRRVVIKRSRNVDPVDLRQTELKWWSRPECGTSPWWSAKLTWPRPERGITPWWSAGLTWPRPERGTSPRWSLLVTWPRPEHGASPWRSAGVTWPIPEHGTTPWWSAGLTWPRPERGTSPWWSLVVTWPRPERGTSPWWSLVVTWPRPERGTSPWWSLVVTWPRPERGTSPWWSLVVTWPRPERGTSPLWSLVVTWPRPEYGTSPWWSAGLTWPRPEYGTCPWWSAGLTWPRPECVTTPWWSAGLTWPRSECGTSPWWSAGVTWPRPALDTSPWWSAGVTCSRPEFDTTYGQTPGGMSGRGDGRPVVVCVEGNISSGKSTFLDYLSKFSDIEVVPEHIDGWRDLKGHNLLDLMYKDPGRWSYVFQSYVQLTMVESHILPSMSPVKAMERSLHSARFCFVENMYLDNKMCKAEYDVYHEWYKTLVGAFDCAVDLIVYLRTDPSLVYARAKSRARVEEQEIPLSYFEDLHYRHEEWMIEEKFPLPAPVFIIDANDDLPTMYGKFSLCLKEIMYMKCM